MALIALAVGTQDRAHRYVRLWVEQAEGSIPLEELSLKFQKVFKFKPHFLTKEADIRNLGLADMSFALNDGIVSLK